MSRIFRMENSGHVFYRRECLFFFMLFCCKILHVGAKLILCLYVVCIQIVMVVCVVCFCT